MSFAILELSTARFCILALATELSAGTLTDVAEPIRVTNTLAPDPGAAPNIIVLLSTSANLQQVEKYLRLVSV